MYFSSAIPLIESCASSAARCASRMRTASRPRFRSGSGEAPGRSDELSAGGLAAATRRSSERLGTRRRRRQPSHVADRRPSASTEAAACSSSSTWRRARGARLPADAGYGRVRALLRRVRRHAARDPFALRQPREPGLGARAAQALLPHVQFRTAGRGDRGSHRAVADACAQLRARRGGALSAFELGAARAGAGAVRGADVRGSLALGCRHRARAAALSRRQERSRRRSRA